MATESEIRSELGHAVDRGKKVGTALGAVTSLAAVAKIVRSVRRG